MGHSSRNPLALFIEKQGWLMLDGGVATALEARGVDLDDPLWSARCLIESPELIRDVHLDYLRAGADCLVTSSYQASYAGFRSRGLDDARIESLFRLSFELAAEARELYLSEARGLRPAEAQELSLGEAHAATKRDAPRPLVAASIGPYGAALADGSEYRGDYTINEGELRAFHERRLRLLAASGADLLACETIPSRVEADVLLELLAELPTTWAWLSFSCRDDRRLSDGSPLRDIAQACNEVDGIAAIGINCTAPQHIGGLLETLRDVTDKPLLVYPNSGERYDAETKRWLEGANPIDLAEAAAAWRVQGAAGIGGCCRVGPEAIERIQDRLRRN